MKKRFFSYIFLLFSLSAFSQQLIVKSHDYKLVLTVFILDGKPAYSITYNNSCMLESSPLGLQTNVGDFSREMQLVGTKKDSINTHYTLDRIKKSDIQYKANELIVTLENNIKRRIDIIFRVSNSDVAFSYRLPQYENTLCCVVEKELSGFNFPAKTTTFLSPQATPEIGWKRTKPSYEEEYIADEPLATPSKYGKGYTFPSLFHVGKKGWVLLSETGVSSSYCASHLTDATADGVYSIAFPDINENNGFGNTTAVFSLPGATPWRTITVSNSLKPIVETTIPFDLVDRLYEPSQKYKYGRSTWSWIMWQDKSMNYDDQLKYIDLASNLGYEYILMDALWDEQIGYERMPSLIKYAQSKGVDVFLWYNSNGYWNDAPQGPRNKLSNSIARKKEMKCLKSMGIKGLKIDFFGGDKQETMKLYEDILSDANEYGLMIIFHGCTLPRGWERMYPNYIGSEAVLASENHIFSQRANDIEAFSACLHPFIRNSVGSMEFGPVLLNKRMNRTNDGGFIRKTTDIFQLATAILFQSSVQMFAIAPNNLTDVPSFEIDFMKQVPTTWDETVYIDGYPGKYCVLARRHADKWYVVGINAQNETQTLKVKLPMLAGKTVIRYADDKNKISFKDAMKIDKSGEVKLTIVPQGGIILQN